MESKLKFLTIGYIEWRKGQDILIDTLEQISDDDLDDSEFIFVGQDSSVMAKGLKERIQDKDYIKILGTVDRNKIHMLLEEVDVLICPSREDPMPTVCAEAMMHSVPCIVSDATGTSAYISDGFNGLVFKSEDIDALKGKILWCINHKDELAKMGDKARKVYEETFSIDVFERKLLSYVYDMINKKD